MCKELKMTLIAFTYLNRLKNKVLLLSEQLQKLILYGTDSWIDLVIIAVEKNVRYSIQR